MKQLFFLAGLLIFSRQSIIAQDSFSGKTLVFNTKIKTNRAHISIGYLYALTDSAIFVSKEKTPVTFTYIDSSQAQKFNYKDLDRVEIYTKGKMWRSPLIGLLTGAAAGALIGYASGNDSQDQFISFTAGEKAAILGSLGGTIGGLIGLFIGIASHKIFFIHGKKENYEKMKNRMSVKLGL